MKNLFFILSLSLFLVSCDYFKQSNPNTNLAPANETSISAADAPQSAVKPTTVCSPVPANVFTIGAATFNQFDKLFCNGDSIYLASITIPDNYSTYTEHQYIFTFTGLDISKGGCYQVQSGLPAYGHHGKAVLGIGISTCANGLECFHFDTPYTVAGKSLCADGTWTTVGGAFSFILRRPTK